jgi:cellulose synthase/poly-beta-1,6-N-acetylglucosamine synthase-like glycosyltransferase
MLALARLVLVDLSWVILAYFFVVNGFYIMLMLSAAWELRWHAFEVRGDSRYRLLSSEIAPQVSMLVPAYNESATVVESLNALLTLSYPSLEVVVVDDGSKDNTLDVLIRAFDLVPIHPIYRRHIPVSPITAVYRSRLYPNLIAASKENGGKADTLNAALTLASGELVCALDADTLIEPDALQRLVRPFIASENVVAAGATIRVANGCSVRAGRVLEDSAPTRLLAGFQAVEYLRAFLFGRVGWNRLGSNLVISGAFGLFLRSALIDAGGYVRTVGEDMEIIVRLRRRGYELGTANRVEFVPDPVAWTEVPEVVSQLGRQRDRWHRGLTDTLWRHRQLFFNPRYGVLGLVVFPAFVLIEWMAPLVEAVGLVSVVLGLLIGAVNVQFAVLFFLVAYGLGVLMSCLALLLEELSFRRYGGIGQRLKLLGWALLENLGYRQLTVWWRLRGMVGFFRGRTEWGAMQRQGFTEPTEPKPT